MYVDLKDNEQIRKVCNIAFPSWNGKTILVVFGKEKISCRSYWDEGCRKDYVFVNLSNFSTLHTPDSHPFFNNANVDNVEIPDGVVCVEMYWRGSSKNITIYTRANNLLNSGEKKIELSEIQYRVLLATRGLKSSYAGIKDLRAKELKERYGYKIEDIDKVRTELIEMGLLDKRKAITTKGANVVEGKFW